MINHIINGGMFLYHGLDDLLSLVGDLKKKGVITTNITIHKARVSFMVVATSNALTPCCAMSSGCIWS